MKSSRPITKNFIDDFISDSTQDALNLKAPTNDPVFTGNVVVPDGDASNEAVNKGQLDSAISGATIADATTTVKGKLKLAGDLSGTADLPTVPGLASKADDSNVIHKAGDETKTGRLTVHPATGYGVTALSNDAVGLYASGQTGAIIDTNSGTPDTALIVNTNGSGDIVEFQSGNTPVAFMDNTGNLILNETLYLIPLTGTPGSFNNIGVDDTGAVTGIPIETTITGSTQISVTNKTGSTITKGSVVYINGAQGSKATIALALADPNDITSAAIGIVAANINNNTSGYVTILGEATNLNTSAFSNGDKVYLSSTIPGALTTTPPTSPNNVVLIGFISNSHVTQGKIVIKIFLSTKLDHLTDVAISTPLDRQRLTYDSASGLWKNTALTSGDITTALGYTPENVTNKQNSLTVDGTGTKYATVDAVNAGIASATIPDATTTIKGKVQLAGDLSGTAAAPTVPGLALKENTANKGVANGYASLDGSGLIPITQIPPAAIERLVIVADQTARFALTTATVQNGDTVKQVDTNVMYYVKDDTNLSNNNGYEVYRAGTAASVPWSGVTSTPTTIAGYGITDAALDSAVVHNTRTINVNGIVQDLSTNREWRTAQADTGVLTFTGLTTNSATTINIGAVTGYVVNNETNPLIPTSIAVSYAGETNKTVTTVGSGQSSYVMLSSAGVISFQNTFPTSAERKAKIWLGKVSHPSGAITIVVNEPDYVTSPMSFARDWVQDLGPYVNNGIYPSPNGVNLNVNISQGTITGDGINFTIDRTNPNHITMGPNSVVNFSYRTQLGGATAGVTLVDPTKYDNAGVITNVPNGSNATIQYWFAIPGLGYIVQYGQTFYSSFNTAVAALGKETFTRWSNLAGNSIPIAALIVTKNCVDLSDTNKAQFFQANKNGDFFGATAGVTTATRQTSYNNSIAPQTIVSDTLGADTWKNGRALDTSKIMAWQNIAGTETASITGNGDLIVHSISAYIATNVQSGTTYTLVASDLGKQIIFTNAAAVTVTIPTGLTAGFNCEFYQQGTGQLSFVVSGTILRYSTFELPQTAEQYSLVALDNVANLTETYHIFGQLSAI